MCWTDDQNELCQADYNGGDSGYADEGDHTDGIENCAHEIGGECHTCNEGYELTPDGSCVYEPECKGKAFCVNGEQDGVKKATDGNCKLTHTLDGIEECFECKEGFHMIGPAFAKFMGGGTCVSNDDVEHTLQLENLKFSQQGRFVCDISFMRNDHLKVRKLLTDAYRWKNRYEQCMKHPGHGFVKNRDELKDSGKSGYMTRQTEPLPENREATSDTQELPKAPEGVEAM